ncbi:uncharacterized protein LOC144563390 isoform X1 [Carex rostrata]
MDRRNYGWGSSSSSGGSSSRKGKKDKQRQPQRGLGVAQLEKIRLQSEMAEYQLPSIQSPFSNLNMSDARVPVPVSLPPSQTYSTARTTVPMSFGGATRGAFYNEAQATSPTVRPLLSAPCNTYQATVHGQPAVTLPLFEGDREDFVQADYDRRWSVESRSLNSDSSDTQDLDLELKL